MSINLLLLKKSGSHKTIPMPSNVTIIGRRHDCDLRIPLMSVSKRHCRLSRDGEVLTIRDLSSRNGTIVNGKLIDESVIKAGDSVKVGPLTFMFQINGEPKKAAQPSMAGKISQKQPHSKKEEADELFAEFTEDDFDALLEDS